MMNSIAGTAPCWRLVWFVFCLSLNSFAVRAASLPTEAEFTNRLGMKFARIKAGSFVTGNDDKLPAAALDAKEHGGRNIWVPERGDFDERPVHRVTISQPFYMGIYEVTNRQYEEFDRLHAHLRGKRGFSIDHDEAVVFVS